MANVLKMTFADENGLKYKMSCTGTTPNISDGVVESVMDNIIGTNVLTTKNDLINTKVSAVEVITTEREIAIS